MCGSAGAHTPHKKFKRPTAHSTVQRDVTLYTNSDAKRFAAIPFEEFIFLPGFHAIWSLSKKVAEVLFVSGRPFIPVEFELRRIFHDPNLMSSNDSWRVKLHPDTNPQRGLELSIGRSSIEISSWRASTTTHIHSIMLRTAIPSSASRQTQFFNSNQANTSKLSRCRGDRNRSSS